MLEWNTLTGNDSEYIVDNYTLSIIEDNIIEMIPASSPWNVTDLIYNLEYEAILTANNCVGESSTKTRWIYSE